MAITKETKAFCKDVESSVLVFQNLESITLKNLKNSIIFIESKGPCFIFAMENSKIFVKCHQLRIHHSFDSEIFPFIDSQNAIIEGCSRLAFKNSDIHINDFDSPGSTSKNYTKPSPSEQDQQLLQKLKHHELQEILDELNKNLTCISH